ncbi:MAG: hypothetical protein PHG95_03790 [Patescibacteria group bacterium]|nr:hypothetical protein [Patescibacteria group bacterium]
MNNKINRLSIAILGFLAFVAVSLFFLSNSYSYSDVDLGWHLRIGQDILNSGRAPVFNDYNYTLLGQKWVDHEWLLNAGMALLFNYGNFISLHLVFLLVLMLAAFFAWQRNLNLLGSKLVFKLGGAIWLFFGLMASRPHLGIRVQEFGLLGVAILFWLFSRPSHFRHYSWYLPFLFMFWANVHGSFLLGLVLLGAYCVYAFVSPLFKYVSHWQFFIIENFDIKFKRQLLAVLILSVLATFINPYGIGLYAFLGTYAHTAYMVYIREWQSQFIFPLFYAQIFYLALAASALALLIKNRRKTLFRFSWWESFLFILFFILAIKSRRHFPLFVLASLPFLSAAFQELGVQIIGLARRCRSLIWRVFAIFFVFILIVYQALNIPWLQNNIQDFCGRKYPCAAVEYLRARPELQTKRLFNSYDWGGYLLWAYPQRQIFIDGRMPQANYQGHTILEEYLRFRHDGEDIGHLLDVYKIDLVLLKKSAGSLGLRSLEKLFFQISEEELSAPDYLQSYLASSPDWQVIFQDNLSILYERQKN